MHALAINFVPRRRKHTLAAVALFCCGLTYAGQVILHFSDAQDDLERALARQAHAARKPPAQRKPLVPAGVAPTDDAQVANRMDSQIHQPWDALLHELESLHIPGVALVQLDVQGQAHTIRITGQAKSMDDIVKYVDRLRHASTLSDVYLTGNEEKTVGPANFISFTLDAAWRVEP